MEYIKKRAENFVRRYIQLLDEHDTLISEAKIEMDGIRSDLDKITFLRIILERNEAEYQNHLLKCTNKAGCPTNFDHESIAYYLSNELADLGIRIDEDQFTPNERDTAEDKLNKIIEEIQTLKTGQRLIYDDLMAELNELKEFYVLGKKKWYQLFLGKTSEMVIGGMISETVSKELIAVMGNIGQKLIS